MSFSNIKSINAMDCLIWGMNSKSILIKCSEQTLWAKMNLSDRILLSLHGMIIFILRIHIVLITNARTFQRVRMPLIAWFGAWILSGCTDQMQYWTFFFVNKIVSELNISHMPPSFLRWETTWNTWTWSKLNSISGSCEATLWYDLVPGTVPLLAKENHQVAKKHPTWDSKETPLGTVHPCTCTPPWMQLLSRWDDVDDQVGLRNGGSRFQSIRDTCWLQLQRLSLQESSR